MAQHPQSVKQKCKMMIPTFYYVRFLILAVIFMGACITYLTRHNINVTIVGMVRKQPTNNSSLNNREDAINTTGPHGYPLFDWDDERQGIILGAFFYSYILLQIPLGSVVEKYGGKWIAGASLVGSALINATTPLVTGHFWLLILSRIVFGAFSAANYPAYFNILTNWMPVENRSFSYDVMDAGGTFGSIITSAMSGHLTDKYGWPSVFYTSAGLACIAIIIFVLFIKNRPEDHFMVTLTELQKINGDVNNGTVVQTYDIGNSMDEFYSDTKECKEEIVKAKTPWLKIIKNPAVLAACLVKMCTNWSYYTIATKFPSFLKNVMPEISMTANGILNSATYLSLGVSAITCGYVSERIIQRNFLSRTKCRKSFQAICGLGSGFCLLLVPFLGNDESSLMALVVIACIFIGFSAGGDGPVAAEMSKHFPVTLYAITNACATSTGFAAPYVIGVILKSYQGPNVMTGWHIVFYLASGLNFMGCLTFILFGSSDRQSFDYL